MPSIPRLNQCFTYFEVAPNIRGDLTFAKQGQEIKCRANEGTMIVKDSRGEDVAYDLTLHTDYSVPLTKGWGVRFGVNYYLIEDVRVTHDLGGKPFMQFVLLKKTNNKV